MSATIMRMNTFSRNRVARSAVGAMAVVTLLAASACSQSSSESDAGDPTDVRRFEGETLTIAGYSATFNDVWAKSFGQHFEDKTGVTVEWLESSPAQSISRIKASGGSPDIDILFADAANLAQAIDGDVVGEIDPDQIPNLKGVDEELLIDQGVTSMLYRYGSCYDTKKFAELGLDTPTATDSWFDPKLAGHVMLPGSTAAQWLITVPAFAKSLGFEFEDAQATTDTLAETDPYGLFNASGDVDAAMTSGDVWLTLGNNQGRCLALKDQGVPVDYAGWRMKIDGEQYSDVLNPDNLILAKGTPKKAIAELFMDEYLSADASAATIPLWQFIAGTPPSEEKRTVLADKDPDSSTFLINDPGALYLPDYLEFLPDLREWNTAWNGLVS